MNMINKLQVLFLYFFSFKSKLRSLKLNVDKIHKVVSSRGHCLQFHPTTERKLMVAGGGNGELGKF